MQLIDTPSSLANHPDVLRISGEFLLVSADSSRGRSSTTTVVVLFADIVNSTGLTEEWGDAAFPGSGPPELDRTLRAVIAHASGRVVEGKTLGDGVLATFLSANDALRCRPTVRDAGNEAGLPLHSALHAGDVIREGATCSAEQ